MESNAIEERVELSMLYDFYGALLKENQQRMFEACILDDYGYTEIAEEQGISRQGVYDAIKRASKQLREYEQKLGLVARFQRHKAQVKQVQKELEAKGLSGDEEQWKTLFTLLEEITSEQGSHISGWDYIRARDIDFSYCEDTVALADIFQYSYYKAVWQQDSVSL